MFCSPPPGSFLVSFPMHFISVFTFKSSSLQDVYFNIEKKTNEYVSGLIEFQCVLYFLKISQHVSHIILIIYLSDSICIWRRCKKFYVVLTLSKNDVDIFKKRKLNVCVANYSRRVISIRFYLRYICAFPRKPFKSAKLRIFHQCLFVRLSFHYIFISNAVFSKTFWCMISLFRIFHHTSL